MSANANDIAGFYHLFLGRVPEDDAVVQSKVGQSRAELFQGFVGSSEFAEIRRRLGEARTKPMLAKRATVDLRRWAADFFEFDFASRERAADIQDTLSLLAISLQQPAGSDPVDALLGEGEAMSIAISAGYAAETWLSGFTTISDLSCCYRLILGRSLETTAELDEHPDTPLATMVAGFLASAEFEEVIARPPLENEHPAAVAIPKDLSKWVTARLGIAADTSRSAAAILAELLLKPVIARELTRWPLSWQPEMLAERLRTTPAQKATETPVQFADDPRRDFSMILGIPIEKVTLPAWLGRVILDRSGSFQADDSPCHIEAEWIVIAPVNALVPPNFVDAVSDLLNARPNVDIFYADDVAGHATRPGDRLRLKPDFDTTLLAAQDYVGAPIFIHVAAFAKLNGLRPSSRTAASADLLFRANAAGMRIKRLPAVLLGYPGERVRAADADYRDVLRTHLETKAFKIEGGGSEPFRQTRCFVHDETPEVTVIIPTRRTIPAEGERPYVERLLASFQSVDWPLGKLSVLVGDDILDPPGWDVNGWPFQLRRIATPRATGQAFNYAEKMNRLWREARTAHLVFLNDDVLPLDPCWLKALVSFSSQQEVGGVGGQLLYPDGSLQHAGLVPAASGATHIWAHRRDLADTYQDWALAQREWAMVTGAVFATRFDVMERLEGFDERFSLEFNDTDLCLRMRRAGLRIVYTPAARFVHVERASRGNTRPPEAEEALFRTRWMEWLDTDPSWHPGLRMVGSEAKASDDGASWYR